MVQELFEQLDELRTRNRRVAMATLVETRGTSPKKEGAKMWVGEAGRVVGSVTIGGCVDAHVIDAAADVLVQELLHGAVEIGFLADFFAARFRFAVRDHSGI